MADDTHRTGKWLGGLFRRDVSARFNDNADEEGVAAPDTTYVPYPEANYWGSRTGFKVFSPEATECLIVDASGNVILDASGNAIACP